MTHGAAAAFLCLSWAVTADEAQEWLAIAEQRGATQAELQTAWVMWNAQNATSVRVVGA